MSHTLSQWAPQSVADRSSAAAAKVTGMFTYGHGAGGMCVMLAAPMKYGRNLFLARRL
jgi:hypothetical protein